METNAFNEAIGGCSLQADDSRVLRPVAFYNRKLAKAKQNFEIYDKEMLAIVACLKEWRVYLKRTQPSTKVYINHLNLTYFMTTKALNLRQARWSEKLGRLQFLNQLLVRTY